jgi:hypothetical protein
LSIGFAVCHSRAAAIQFDGVLDDDGEVEDCLDTGTSAEPPFPFEDDEAGEGDLAKWLGLVSVSESYSAATDTA